MKYFLLILSFFCLSQIPCVAQNTLSLKADSIRAANKAKSDALKAINAARRDSIDQVRKLREAKKKEAERAKKRKKKEANLEEDYTQTEYTSADSLREYKRDSTKLARQLETEKRKRLLAEKQEILLAGKKKKIEPLTQEMSGGFRLNSDGWALFVNRAFINEEDNKKTFFSVDFSERNIRKRPGPQAPWLIRSLLSRFLINMGR
ncbi:hypothetical protein EMGBS15_17900 [Filimonas sp.]|nr:hypothetical protein EMGBS15_17900 [Filimonas sp.]